MFIGKLLGALFGYLAGGPIGAIVGFIAGYFFDKGLKEVRSSDSPQHNADIERAFFTTVFTVMGHLAKADGRVSEEEIAGAEHMMEALGLTPERRREAIDLFKRGTAADFQVEPQISDFLQHCSTRPELKGLLLEYLLGMALADGVLHAAEQELLQRVATYLGVSAQQFEQLLEMLRAQQRFHAGGPQAAPDALADAYRALGVTPQASDSEVKTAFRRLMSQHHPDKLIAQGVPEDMIRLATEKAQEIQAAYALIERSRR